MLFVTFLLFLLVILAPALNTNKDKKSLSESVERSVLNKTSSVLKTVTVSISSSVSSNCVSISSFLSEFGFDSRILIVGEGNVPISGSLSSDSSTLQINRNSSSENLLKIYNSDVFLPLGSESLSCVSVSEGSDYELGIVKSEIYVFEEKIISLLEEYSDYDQLKSDLNIPNGTDLGVGFIFSNGTLINTTEKDVSTNIYVTEKQVNYVDSQGKILSGKLRIRVW
jgi:hypothetical protein